MDTRTVYFVGIYRFHSVDMGCRESKERKEPGDFTNINGEQSGQVKPSSDGIDNPVKSDSEPNSAQGTYVLSCRADTTVLDNVLSHSMKNMWRNNKHNQNTHNWKWLFLEKECKNEIYNVHT